MATRSEGVGAINLAGGWPAYLLVLLTIVAAVFSFSHRPLPAFAPTQIYPDRLLVNGLAVRDGRIVAAGDLGHILIADSPGGPWREAKVEPARGSTLARAAFLDDKTVLAVGHDGWILRSEDRGETWKEVAFNADRPDPLLGIAGPYGGKLFAFGAFGLFETSSDLGKSWQAGTLNIESDGKAAAPKVDPNADPFAAFAQGSGDGADRHLNAMTKLADGSLLLVGERGLLLSSHDDGASWKKLDAGYAGSFYGVLSLDGGRVLVFGMRGHAFFSDDLGKTWNKAETPGTLSLFSGTALPDGRVVLVGDNNAVLVSADRGGHFRVAAEAEHHGLAASLAEVRVLPDGSLLTAGDGGVARMAMPAGTTP